MNHLYNVCYVSGYDGKYYSVYVEGKNEGDAAEKALEAEGSNFENRLTSCTAITCIPEGGSQEDAINSAAQVYRHMSGFVPTEEYLCKAAEFGGVPCVLMATVRLFYKTVMQKCSIPSSQRTETYFVVEGRHINFWNSVSFRPSEELPFGSYRGDLLTICEDLAMYWFKRVGGSGLCTGELAKRIHKVLAADVTAA